MAISSTSFHFREQSGFYRGKVRDVYYLGTDHLVLIATDRISAFDVVLPRPIPFKGQILGKIATRFLEDSAHLVPNWLIGSPAARVSYGYLCKPFKVEMVIRGYLTGHAWREYRDGKRMLCGVPLPDGLKEHDRLPEPIITPTTKADAGHDQDISKAEIIEQGIVSTSHYLQLEEYTRTLFEYGTRHAEKRGLILVDTKYEFGLYDGKVLLMDEIHTPDSSRYFYAEGYEERQLNGDPQRQLSKEFVREWLISENFMGKEGQTIPDMTDEIIQGISRRYIELYERITGESFEPEEEDLSVLEEKINTVLA